jgi:hypothetical protein
MGQTPLFVVTAREHNVEFIKVKPKWPMGFKGFVQALRVGW